MEFPIATPAVECRRFTDRTVLVTGAGSGIGAATSVRLAAEGAHVVMVDRDEAALCRTSEVITARNGSAETHVVDLIDLEAVKTMGTETARRHQALHGLVNNAGIIERVTIEDSWEQSWERVMSVNVRGSAACVRALLPLLRAGSGHIVNLSSECAYRSTGVGWIYASSKASMLSLTRMLAHELKDDGIRVNAVAPGWIYTGFGSRHRSDAEAYVRELENKRWDQSLIPRLGRPEEVAPVIAFLLSDDASYMTAATINVDGGLVPR